MKCEDKMTGIKLIARERKRQIEKEGWTAEHDDEHKQGQLVDAAVCYALPEKYRDIDIIVKYTRNYTREFFDAFWPWEDKDWKPTPDNRIRELEKAGALIAAEIDRLLRKEEKEKAI